MSYIQSKISTNTYVDERDTPLQVKQQLASPFLLCETRNDLEQIRSMVCLPWMPSQKDLLDFHLNVYECLFYCSLFFFILFKALVSLLSFHSQQYILTLQELAALYKQKARFRIILLLMSPQSYYHHPPTWPK